MPAITHQTMMKKSWVLWLLLSYLVVAPYGYAQSRDSEVKWPTMYWSEKLMPDGKLMVRKYEVKIKTEVDLSGLEIWNGALGKDDPFDSIYWTEPDWKLEMLRRGFARLKDERNAQAKYVEAQTNAKNARHGLWSSLPAPPLPSPSLPEPESRWGTLKKAFYVVVVVVFGVTSWFGGSAIIKLIRDWRRRHRVPLILLGRPSTGKTWLYTRLIDPDVSTQELRTIRRSDVATRKKMPKSKPMGRYEIIADYYDNPGNKPGYQVDRLLEEKGFLKRIGRLLIPTKSVWMITLATTPDVSVSNNSPAEAKVDEAYIREQLGHLDLPLGMLSSKRTPKPQMVITCINKFDLFAERDAKDSTSENAENSLRSIFLPHIKRVEEECKSQRIPFKLVMCSALRGWGAPEVWKQVEKAIFE